MLEEIPGSGGSEFTTKGADFEREFLCEWDERFLVCPRIGQSHPEWAWAIVKRVRIRPEGAPVARRWGSAYTHARIEVAYTQEYQRPKLGDPPRVTWHAEVEALRTGVGFIWDDTGEVAEDPECSPAIPIPMQICTIDMAVNSFPKIMIDGLIGKVNNSDFEGAAKGCLLFLDYDFTAELDWETNCWYFRIQFRLAQKQWEHNKVWRPPIPDVDENGKFMRYQNKNTGAVNYTTDSALIGRLVYKNEGGWTTTTPRAYAETDFDVIYTLL